MLLLLLLPGWFAVCQVDKACLLPTKALDNVENSPISPVIEGQRRRMATFRHFWFLRKLRQFLQMQQLRKVLFPQIVRYKPMNAVVITAEGAAALRPYGSIALLDSVCHRLR
ncbi:MAG: hypothetical protein K8I30_14040 [Anaerolineae bacterium]|nr:hypothetical protein [Anaerolineae bacterium]